MTATAERCSGSAPTSLLPHTLDGRPPGDFPGRWTVARVRLEHEKPFVRDLIARRIPYFVPWRVRRRVYDCRHVRITQSNLFPTYAFICGGVEEWYGAADCFGFVDHVFTDYAEAAQGRLRADLCNLAAVMATNPDALLVSRLRPGDRVTVTDRAHPLYGVSGRFTHYGGHGHLMVALHLLGQEIETEITEPASVEPYLN